jgi:hypothetical protein
MYLIATFSTSFFVTLGVASLPQNFQNIIYENNSESAAFNLIAIFFGIGMQRLPIKHFGRIVLVIYIFFCLIIRTAYQGVLFEMMTKEIRKPSPRTIQEIVDFDYKIIYQGKGSRLTLAFSYDEILDLFGGKSG